MGDAGDSGGSTGGSGGTGGAGGSGGSVGGSGGIDGGVTYRLSIEFLGDGVGEVDDRFGSLCQDNCEITRPDQYQQVLSALPTNGTDSYFAGFGGDCSGISTCTLVMDGDKSVTVEFRTQLHNFVFLSSTTPYSNLGGAARYDEECNDLATLAGINTVTNDGYVAWTSDDNSLAIDRLGSTARGWVRLDGKPVADTMSGLLDSGEIYHSIRVDDLGVEHDNESVRTGTLADGSAAPDNCNNFRSDALGWYVTHGLNYGGPLYWTDGGVGSCVGGVRILCFGKTKSNPIVLEPVAGKLIYLSDLFTPNTTTTPDEVCAASAPAGAGTVRAMTTYWDVPGANFVTGTTLYVRPDGQAVGTGAEILEASAPGVQATVDNYLRTGVWQTGDGAYAYQDVESLVWIGDWNILRGAGTGTCNNWTTTTGSGAVGDYRSSGASFWNLEAGTGYPNRLCSNAYRFYCVEQ